MQFKFGVLPDAGDAYDVTATTRDIAFWEKVGKGRSFGSLGDNMKMTDMYELAHHAARRQGLYDGTLQQFEESVDLEMKPGEGTNPTQQDR